MESLNLNHLLNREEEANKIKEILKNFELKYMTTAGKLP